MYLASKLSKDDVRSLVKDLPVDHVVLATGASWRRDGVGRANPFPIFDHPSASVYSPDDVMAGESIEGPIVVFDDDHYYMGGVLAEKLAATAQVTLVTPASVASAWSANTLELWPINRRLRERGVRVVTSKNVVSFDGDHVELSCVFGGEGERIAAKSVVSVTSRLPHDGLMALRSEMSMRAIGDALAPSTIAAAVYAGHRYARELDEPSKVLPFLRDGNLRPPPP